MITDLPFLHSLLFERIAAVLMLLYAILLIILLVAKADKFYRLSTKCFGISLVLFMCAIITGAITISSVPDNSLHTISGKVRAIHYMWKRSDQDVIVIQDKYFHTFNLHIDPYKIGRRVNTGDLVTAQVENDILGRNYYDIWSLVKGSNIIISKDKRIQHGKHIAEKMGWFTDVLAFPGLLFAIAGLFVRYKNKDESNLSNNAGTENSAVFRYGDAWAVAGFLITFIIGTIGYALAGDSSVALYILLVSDSVLLIAYIYQKTFYVKLECNNIIVGSFFHERTFSLVGLDLTRYIVPLGYSAVDRVLFRRKGKKLLEFYDKLVGFEDFVFDARDYVLKNGGTYKEKDTRWWKREGK